MLTVEEITRTFSTRAETGQRIARYLEPFYQCRLELRPSRPELHRQLSELLNEVGLPTSRRGIRALSVGRSAGRIVSVHRCLGAWAEFSFLRRLDAQAHRALLSRPSYKAVGDVLQREPIYRALTSLLEEHLLHGLRPKVDEVLGMDFRRICETEYRLQASTTLCDSILYAVLLHVLGNPVLAAQAGTFAELALQGNFPVCPLERRQEFLVFVA